MKLELDDIRHTCETRVTIRGPRRRTTVPKVICDALGLENGDTLQWILLRDNTLILRKL